MNALKSILVTLFITVCMNSRAQTTSSPESISLVGQHILVVWGGWEGHQPEKFAKKVSDWARNTGANVTISDSLGIYKDKEFMENQDLVIQYWTMGTITEEESKGLIQAIKSGTGLVGCHGGIGDSFRNNTDYQYMVGGQWVTHPGGKINYTVTIEQTNDPVTKGIKDFDIFNTEQYYMHVDPNVQVLATTTFNADHDSWIKGHTMPVVWKKYHDKGRVFYISIGHNPEDFDHPAVWTMLTRGIDWAINGNHEDNK